MPRQIPTACVDTRRKSQVQMNKDGPEQAKTESTPNLRPYVQRCQSPKPAPTKAMAGPPVGPARRPAPCCPTRPISRTSQRRRSASPRAPMQRPGGLREKERWRVGGGRAGSGGTCLACRIACGQVGRKMGEHNRQHNTCGTTDAPATRNLQRTTYNIQRKTQKVQHSMYNATHEIDPGSNIQRNTKQHKKAQHYHTPGWGT